MKTSAIETKIKKLNAAYRKATAAQRRVMIAKDALAQLKSGRFQAEEGTWTDVRTKEGDDPDENAPLQPILHTPGVTCNCCGVGAVFLSYVRLNNKATPDQGHDFWDMQHATGWPSDNLRLIELAFESGDGNCRSRTEQEEKAALWGADIPDSNDRLVAILKNIVTNHGTFKP